MSASPVLAGDVVELQPAPSLKLAGFDGELVVQVDAVGRRCATVPALARWLGYGHRRALLNLMRRYSADLAAHRGVTRAMTPRGQRAQVVYELGWYVLALVAQTDRGRALRRLFATWLMDDEPNRRAPQTAGEVFASAQAILRATHRRVKALARSPRPDGVLDKDGKPRLLLVGAEVEVMAEAVALAGEAAPVIEFAVGGPQQVAMAHRKPLRRDDA